MLLSSPVMLTLAAAEGNNTRLPEHCPDSPWKHRGYTHFHTTRSLERTHEHQPSPGFCFRHEREELIVDGIYWLRFIKKHDIRVDTLIPSPFVARFKFESVKKKKIATVTMSAASMLLFYLEPVFRCVHDVERTNSSNTQTRQLVAGKEFWCQSVKLSNNHKTHL